MQVPNAARYAMPSAKPSQRVHDVGQATRADRLRHCGPMNPKTPAKPTSAGTYNAQTLEHFHRTIAASAPHSTPALFGFGA